MKDAPTDRWKRLCAELKRERDTDRLMALVKEINRLLDEGLKKLTVAEDMSVLF